MTSSKALQIEKDIDAARCKANWAAIPELARRYKKHNLEGTVLEQTILAELALTQTLQKYYREKSWSSNAYDDDGPDRISLPPRLPPELLKAVIVQLEGALKAKATGAAAVQHKFTTLILARAHFEIGANAKVLELLSDVSLPPESVSGGYGFVLIIQSKTIKGISLEMTGNFSAALAAYDEVLSFLNMRSMEKNDELLNWSEEALYRAALIRLRGGQSAEALNSFRAYQTAAAAWLPFWRVHKRVTLFRHFIKLLSKSYQAGLYVPPSAAGAQGQGQAGSANASANASASASPFVPQTFRLEITHMHTVYEEKLYSITLFPKAGCINRRVLEFVDQIVADWEVIGGGSSVELRGLVETLQRAQHKTFNSPRIQRHLFNALVRLGEFEEAEHALKAYLALTGHAHDHASTTITTTTITTITTTTSPLPAKAQNIVEQLDSRPKVEENEEGAKLAEEMVKEKEKEQEDEMGMEKEKEKEKEGEKEKEPASPTTPSIILLAGKNRKLSRSSGLEIGEECESEADVIEMLISGVRLMCKDLAKGEAAVEYAELVVKVWDAAKKKGLVEGKAIEGRIWRAVGVAYGLLAYQTYDPDVRPTYHEKSLDSLTKSIDLDPDSWESYYQLSLQYAEMRDINQATTTITKTLQINPTHLPSWHLLTLLFSCPVQSSNPNQALQTCDIGLKESEWDAAVTSDAPVDVHVNGLATSSPSRGSADEGEQFLSLKMTQTALLDLLNGTEAGLQTHESLFTLYGKVFSPDSQSGSSSLYNGVPGGSGRRTGAADGIHSGPGSHDDVANLVAHTGMTLSASAVPIMPAGEPLGSNTQLGASLSTPNVKANSVRSADSVLGASPTGLRLSPSKRTKRGRKKSLGAMSINTALASDMEQGGGSAISTGSNLDIPRASYASSISTSSLRSLQSPTPSIGTATSIKSIYQPTNLPTRPSTRSRMRRLRSLRGLTSLWLASAAAFRRLGKLEDAHKALEEAEGVDVVSADVWCQLGLLSLVEKKTDAAVMAFRKALACDPVHVMTKVHLARTYLEMNELELAEGLLESVTRGNGWDCAEAWFYFSQVFQKTDRIERTKDCLWYALDLEGTRPVRSFSVLPRWV